MNDEGYSRCAAVLGSWFCRRHPDMVGGWFFVGRRRTAQKKNFTLRRQSALPLNQPRCGYFLIPNSSFQIQAYGLLFPINQELVLIDEDEAVGIHALGDGG